MRVSTRVAALVAALLVSCVLLAACSSSGSGSGSGSASGSAHRTTTTTAAPATGTGATTITAPTLESGTTLPAPATSGTLAIAASVAVPTTTGQMAAGEAPDGTVFVASVALSPTSLTPQIVWVVDGDGPAAVAEHVGAAVNALAADNNYLYVATARGVTSFDRATGNKAASWKLPLSDPTSTPSSTTEAMAAAGGRVLVSLDERDVVSVYRINPDSMAAPKLVAQGSSAVFGPDGTVYYVRTDHRLVALSPDGTLTVGPAMADDPDSSGDGVQYLDTVAEGSVWVEEPADKGAVAEFTVFSPTLHQTASFNGTEQQQMVDTAAGTLALNAPGSCAAAAVVTGASGATSSTAAPAGAGAGSCIARYTADGTASDPVPVSSAFQLLGPEPVVLTVDTTDSSLVVQRLQ
jgi:hypothetical protein